MSKICILLPSHWNTLKGGAEYQADCFSKYLAKNTDYDISYLSRNATENNNAYSVVVIPPFISNQKYGLFWDAIILYKKLLKINPDVIWQRVGCAYTGVAAFYCKRKHKSLIWHIALDDDVFSKKLSFKPKKIPISIDRVLLNYGIKNANEIVAQTNKQAEMLRLNYKREVSAVISNFHPFPQSPPKKPVEFIVLWIANFKPVKQPEIFVQLAADFSHNTNITFRMIGRPHKSVWGDEILAEIKKLNNLEYLGELETDEVNEQINSSHVLVNTSVFEGFSNTFIQAWMREVVVLSLNVDPDGVINEHGLGLYAQNYENMKDYLERVSTNLKELALVAEHARQYAKENYSMENARRLTSLIDSEISRLKRED